MLGMSSNEDAGGSFDMVEEVWWSGGKVYGNEGGVMMRWMRTEKYGATSELHPHTGR